MAKKEALRDLQNRLSERLRSAQTQTVAMAWLAVVIGPSHYLFPLSQSGEIFSLTGVARVPYTRPWFSGVVNLRGGLYGVVDLAVFMEHSTASSRSEQALSQARLISVNVDLGINCAFAVDALMGLRRAESFTAEQPLPDGSPSYFGHRFLDREDRPWQEINLQALTQMPGFLAIGT